MHALLLSIVSLKVQAAENPADPKRLHVLQARLNQSCTDLSGAEGVAIADAANRQRKSL
jgi:hypothetical protein